MKLQTFFEKAGKYSCLAQCYIYAVADYIRKQTPITDDAMLNLFIFQSLQEAYRNQPIIDDEFFVNNPVALMKIALQLLVGKDASHYVIDVLKKDINSYSDLPLYAYAAVRHDYNGHSHWVLAYNQERLYDSLENSVCSKYGKPTTARIINIGKK